MCPRPNLRGQSIHHLGYCSPGFIWFTYCHSVGHVMENCALCVLCLHHNYFSFCCCEILPLFTFGARSKLSYNFNFFVQHTALFIKGMSFYREIEVRQYADCRGQTRACQFGMVLIHKHTQGGEFGREISVLRIWRKLTETNKKWILVQTSCGC